jgi:hypothetical protein
MNKILANVHNNKHLIRFILIRVIYFNPLAPMLQIRIILNAFQFTLLYKNNITFLFVISFNFDFHIILSVSSTKDKITGIFYKPSFLLLSHCLPQFQNGKFSVLCVRQNYLKQLPQTPCVSVEIFDWYQTV